MLSEWIVIYRTYHMSNSTPLVRTYEQSVENNLIIDPTLIHC